MKASLGFTFRDTAQGMDVLVGAYKGRIAE